MFINWSPMRKLIWLKASGGLVPDLPWQTFTGNPLTFIARTAHALKSCVVGIEPVQSGSGDPSPDNVRPISGFTGANVTRTGVNVWDEEWEVGDINSSGANAPASDRIRSKNYISVTPNTIYYIKASYGVWFWGYDINKNYVGCVPTSSSYNNQTITLPSGIYYIRFVVRSGYGTTYNHDISINYPSTDHDYHASNVSTIPISWQSSAGTVYGGSLDVTTGVLTVTHIGTVYNGTENWKKETQSGTNSYYINRPQNVINPPSSLSAGDVLCSVCPVNLLTWSQNVMRVTSGYYNFVLGNSFATLDDFKTFMANNQVAVVEPLATPQTYQLTAQEVSAIVGQNTMWTDCANLTVEAKGTAS